MRVNDIGDRLGNIIRVLANRLTAADNFGPDGKKWQVLTSRGPRPTDPPPYWEDIQNVISGALGSQAALLGAQGPAGLQGPAGATGPQGPAGDEFGDLDGGTPSSVYGGMFVVDGGGI